MPASIENVDNTLTARELGYLRYLRGMALQPPDSWAGFYRTPSEGMNFGLRFQIAFMGYALYALARRTPAYRAPYAAALRDLIERMAQAETWAYWLNGARSLQARANLPKSRMQNAVEFVHTKMGTPGFIPPDPCQQGNIQYSAHLASLLGFYQMLTDDARYDREGLYLRAEADGEQFEFHYTHSSLSRHLAAQMQESHFGGVCCEPGRAYVACNNHVCISNLLYDRLHGTDLAQANGRWAEWVEKKMLTGGLNNGLPLPAPNGLLSVAYMSELHLPLPVSFNLTDAWGLAFMAAWQPGMVGQIYPRLRRRLKADKQGQLHLGSLGPTESLEISTSALNTAFAAVLAREMGDTATQAGLLAWAESQLEPVSDPVGGYYYQAKPAPYVTALLAIAEALPAEGGGLYSLMSWRPDFAAPYLAEVSPEVEVSAASYEAGVLEIELRGQPGTAFRLRIENCANPEIIRFDQSEIRPGSPAADYDPAEQTLSLNLRLATGESRLFCNWK